MGQYHASNPANVRVEMGHFLKCDLKDIIILFGSILLAGIIVTFNWKPALIVLGIGLFVSIFSLYEAKSLFLEGDVCPAMVVDAKRGLVAVLSDLSKGGDKFPVIKILKQPLGRATGGPFKKGSKLAFVAMYNGNQQEAEWRSFGGYLVNSGTTKKKAIKRVVSSISETEWQQLKRGLSQIEQPFRAGQYEDIDV